MAAEVIFEYELSSDTQVSAEKIQRLSREVWKEMLQAGTPAHQAAVAAGVDVSQLPPDIEDVLDIRASGAGVGVDPLSLFIGAVLTGGAKVCTDLWKKVVLPRIEQRYGVRAVTPKKSPKKVTVKDKEV